LFFNTPARRKFLKRPATEFGQISEQFTRVALANPGLHLVLRHNGNSVHELPATSNTLERIRRFCGSDLSDKLIAVESQSDLPDGGVIRLWGYVGEPSVSKSTRRSQYLFLNGRCIQDRSLQHALSEAYRGLLMVGRHPISYLFLELPPGLVDVNVHPTKTEVRFQDSQTLYRQLLRTLRDKFLSLDFRSRLDLKESAPQPTLSLQPQSTSAGERQQALNLWADSEATHRAPDVQPVYDTPGTTAERTQPSEPAANAVEDHRRAAEFRPFPTDTDPLTAAVRHQLQSHRSPQSATVAGSADAAEQAVASDVEVATTQPAGQGTANTDAILTDEFRAFQIHDCYLVVATDAGLEVIDQHALHERILYEHLRRRILNGSVERQKLLIPEPVELTATESALVQEHAELLREIGFEVEDFGGTTVLLTAYPVLMPKRGLAATVKEIAEQLEQKDGKTSRRDLLDRMLHTMSCRAAIKSGQRLTVEEMQELLRQRHLVDDSHHCPHGRPTALTLTRGNLDQQFGRLG
jgi:DNA mismatch repair protein MutL